MEDMVCIRVMTSGESAYRSRGTALFRGRMHRERIAGFRSTTLPYIEIITCSDLTVRGYGDRIGNKGRQENSGRMGGKLPGT